MNIRSLHPNPLVWIALVSVVVWAIACFLLWERYQLAHGENLSIRVSSHIDNYNIKISDAKLLAAYLTEYNLKNIYKSRGVGFFGKAGKVYPRSIWINLVDQPQSGDKLLAEIDHQLTEIRSVGSRYDSGTQAYILDLYLHPSLLEGEYLNKNVSAYIIRALFYVSDPPSHQLQEKLQTIEKKVWENEAPFVKITKTTAGLSSLFQLIPPAYAQSCSGNRSCSTNVTQITCSNPGGGSCVGLPCDEACPLYGNCICTTQCTLTYTEACNLSPDELSCWANGCGVVLEAGFFDRGLGGFG